MIGRELPEDGILRRGVIYRWKGKGWPPPDPSPEVLEVVRRGEQKLIREYLERKKRAS